MKKQINKMTAWLLVDGKGIPMTCNCHPSKKISYVLYKTKNKNFDSSNHRKIIIHL